MADREGEGAVQVGRAPHWDEALAFAATFRDFKNAWRFNSPTRGARTEARFFADFARETVARPTVAEINQLLRDFQREYREESVERRVAGDQEISLYLDCVGRHSFYECGDPGPVAERSHG